MVITCAVLIIRNEIIKRNAIADASRDAAIQSVGTMMFIAEMAEPYYARHKRWPTLQNLMDSGGIGRVIRDQLYSSKHHITAITKGDDYYVCSNVPEKYGILVTLFKRHPAISPDNGDLCVRDYPEDGGVK